MAVEYNKDIQFIKGVGPNRVKLLNKLNIYNLYDLITYFPREHEDRGKIKSISEVIDGEECLISGFPVGRVNEIKIRKDRNERVLITTLTIRMAEELTNYLKNLESLLRAIKEIIK